MEEAFRDSPLIKLAQFLAFRNTEQKTTWMLLFISSKTRLRKKKGHSHDIFPLKCYTEHTVCTDLYFSQARFLGK